MDARRPSRTIEVRRLPGRWAVAKLDPRAPIPPWAVTCGADAAAAAGADGSVAARAGAFVSVTRTAHELSITVPEALVPADVRAERGFALLEVAGPLPFDAVGVFARLTAALAAAQVSVFAVSTFDTDYLLVRDDRVEEAARALAGAGVAVS